MSDIVVPPAALAAQTPFEEACAALAASTKPDNERLQELFKAAWDYRMREYPEAATYNGYPGQNDRWTDLSLQAIERRKRELHAPLKTLDTIRPGNLNQADRLSYDLFRCGCEKAVEGTRFPGEYLQINQLGGVHQFVANIVRAMPKFTVKDYRDIIARLNAVGGLVDQTIVLLEKGLSAGITPPKVTLRDVVRQVDSQLVADPEKSPILESLQDSPSTLPAEDLRLLRAAATEAVRTNVLPAYRRLRAFLAEEYVPQARETTAMQDLPDGESWYTFRVRVSTTTTLTPREIHEIGLREVDRINAEMEKTMQASGFTGTRAEFSKFLRTDPRFYYQSREDLLIGYRDICKRADAELMKFFGMLPRQPYGVMAVPGYAEKSQPVAYYEAGSTKAGRTGTFYANAYDLKSHPKWEMEALVLHEAVPGHHLQIALADEMEGVPEFRKHGNYTAYVEGWGLYAESLGYEMGFYRGRLCEVRPALLRDVASRPPRRGHGHPCHGLEPGTGRRLLPQNRRPHGTRRCRGGGPLHRLARPGPGLQDRPAQDPGAARMGRRGAGRQIRPPRLPRRGPPPRRPAPGRSGGADPGMGCRAEGMTAPVVTAAKYNK